MCSGRWDRGEGAGCDILCAVDRSQAIIFAIYLPVMSIVSAACVDLAGSCKNKCDNEVCCAPSVCVRDSQLAQERDTTPVRRRVKRVTEQAK